MMIYFDNSATTKPFPEVLKTYVTVSEQYFANPSSIHRLGGEVERLLSRARQQIAQMIGAEESEIIFTSGGTEANNLAIKGIAARHRKRGNHIISTEVEHASCYEAFKKLEEEGFEVTFLPVDRNGRVSVNEVEKALRDETVLVSVMHVNNELGTIQPIRAIGELLKSHPKVFFHVDNIQAVGKLPLQLKNAGIDCCSYSSHKFHGPKGVGFLYIRDGVALSPLLTGGSQEHRFRAGTENVPGIVGMAKALRMTLEKAKTHMAELLELNAFLRKGLTEMGETFVNTPERESAPHILNFSIPGIKPEVLIHALEEKEIYVSTKSACSSKATDVSRILEATGHEYDRARSAIRISFSFDNTLEEGKRFMESLQEVLSNLKKVMR